MRIYEARPGELDDLPDFTVIDDQHVAHSVYDAYDRFVYGEPVTGLAAAPYRILARQLWERAVDFRTWWDAHPKAHRRHRA